MPEIKESFAVGRPVAVVWDFFQDVPAVAGCMPGVALTQVGDDGAYAGEMKVKLGPIGAAFVGEARITELDRSAWTGTLLATGVDRRQGSSVSATVRYALNPEAAAAESTTVDITAVLALRGAMAQFGRTGLLQEISTQLTREFATRLEASLAGAAPAAAAAPEHVGGAVLRRGVWTWVKGLFRLPLRHRDSR